MKYLFKSVLSQINSQSKPIKPHISFLNLVKKTKTNHFWNRMSSPFLINLPQFSPLTRAFLKDKIQHNLIQSNFSKTIATSNSILHSKAAYKVFPDISHPALSSPFQRNLCWLKHQAWYCYLPWLEWKEEILPLSLSYDQSIWISIFIWTLSK